ncbi:histidine kinase [Flavobacterium jejuense]|uniref:Histidine kinase n=1 Tax=Flavobacterium jejuense TaxID=1544455 RepID=A0ABX0IQZ3_9FLAO|nr:histidine kinase [Flavobacterium jejuense]NHN26222.1 histidine kinase [Flavobacterium jejuense]
MSLILKQVRTHKYFLLFIFLFGYAQSIQIRFLIRRKISWYLFTPEAAVSTFISSCLFFSILLFLMKKWQKAPTFDIKEAFKIVSTSLVLYIVILKAFGLSISILFGNLERNFNSETLTHSLVGNFMDALIYGSFFLAYYYFQKNKNYQNQITIYNNALSENKINQLKAQLNPHFLFNNLNVLDQLIEEDKNVASDFLNEFAEMYRYVLEVSDKKLVTLKEELSFAKNYFSLMEHKYGNAFQLEIEQKNDIPVWIAPLTLQLLIENAIKHNLGTENNPVTIKIKIEDNIVVSNTLIKKQNLKLISGKGLQNLKEQYYLLSNQKIDIKQQEALFIVTLPLISFQKK